MVKNSKKPKNNNKQSPSLPQRQSNSKFTVAKSVKKCEKFKVSTTATITKGLSKSKVTQQQQQLQQPSDTDAPSTSKQGIMLAANGNVIRPKSQSKLQWGGIWKRIEKKKDLSTLTSRKHTRPQRRLSPAPEPSLTPTSPPNQMTDLSPAEDTSTFEEVEVASLLQSGIIRYSDVVRSKNVSSSASLKPPNLKIPTIPLPIGNTNNTNNATTMATTTATTTTTTATATTAEAAAIDLEYFPELGQQHKTWQGPHSHSASSSRFSRKQLSLCNDDKTTTLLCSPESPNSKSKGIENCRKETIARDDINSTTPSQATPICHQCQLNAQWLERVIQNSAKPFHINIPEFNFLQPDIAYPRFLMQYEDENYLKAENMALLGLKLALGGNFHRQHTNFK